MNFDKHVEKLCKSVERQFKNVLYRFRGIFDIKEKEMMFNTFILSKFNYCPIIWHFCGKPASKQVEHIQERAVRFMFNEPLLDRC